MNYKIKTKWLKFLHSTLNLAVIAMFLVLLSLLAKNHLTSNSGNSARKEISRGEKILFPEDEFQQNTKTLFLFLYSQCSHCANSKSFYQKLVEVTNGKDNIRLIPVFTNEDENSNEFLKEIKYKSEASKKISFTSVGVFETPVIILADGNGIVNEVWKGKLTPQLESSVMDAIGVPTDENQKKWLVSEDELNKLIDKKNVSLVDIRERENYKKEHLSAAVNIPFDELAIRAANELTTSDTIVLYDDYNNTKKAESAVATLLNQGFQNVLILERKTIE